MFDSRSCVQCQRPVVGDNASGLCPTCALSTGANRADGTAQLLEQTAFAPPFPNLHGSPLDAPTRTHRGESVPVLAAEDPILRRLPAGYDPLEVLGQGGMGLVLKVWERSAERVVAVKLIRAVPDHELLERFRVEAKALAGLKHPNLVPVLTVAVDAPDPYFTMEFMEGGGLDRRLKQDGPLPIAEALRVIEGAARGVAAAHAAGVVHRDIKPGNVLLAADGTPKVTDFGLAKRRDRDDPDLTVSGALVGTPNYMAPEQAGRRNRTVGEPADVYGLGATLYHLLTGKAPFRGMNQLDTIDKVLRTSPVSPRTLRPEVPADLEAVILKCLEKDPADRYHSANELADDLARVRSGQPPVGPAGWRQRAWRRVRRSGPVAVGFAIVLVLMALGLPLVWQPASAGREEKARQTLDRDQEVVVVPASGVPEWLKENWLLGGTALEATPASFNSCSFESIEDALLAVMRDPGRDRYTATFDLCMLRTKLVAPGNGDQTPGFEEVATRNIGVFFGHNKLAGADGSEAHTFMLVELMDYLPERIQKAGITQGRVKLDAALVHDRLGKRRSPHFGSGLELRFPASPTLPGNWRQIRLEVAPEAVRVFWAATPGENQELVAEVLADKLQDSTASMQSWFDRYAPEARLAVAPWRPRTPFGIWSRGAAVAVRNVVVAPLP